VQSLSRPLENVVVNLSLSESADSEGLGFPASELQRTFIRMVAGILGQGGRILLGHDWRDDGLMESVTTFVERYRPTSGELKNGPLVTNLLPWPDKSRLNLYEQRALLPSLKIRRLGRPTLRSDTLTSANSTKALRQESLSRLRVRLTNLSDARLCVGGRMTEYQGRYPGVIEEAICSLNAAKPVYVFGFLGGASRVVIDALQGDMPKVARGVPPSPKDLASAIDKLRNVGVAGVAKANHLSVAENRKLFAAETIDEAFDLVLIGIRRLIADRKQ
jgi:hypothetical protein